MKILKNFRLILLVALSFSACKNGTDAEADSKLKEAGELHDASLIEGNEVSKLFTEAEVLVASAEKIIPTLNPIIAKNADALLGSINELKAEYDSWTDLLVEVPGHAHAHIEGGGEHHHNHSMDNASPDEILTKQKKLNAYITDIKARLIKAMKPIQAIVEPK